MSLLIADLWRLAQRPRGASQLYDVARLPNLFAGPRVHCEGAACKNRIASCRGSQ